MLRNFMVEYEIVSRRVEEGKAVSAYIERRHSLIFSEPTTDLGKKLLELHLEIFREEKANLLETKVKVKF